MLKATLSIEMLIRVFKAKIHMQVQGHSMLYTMESMPAIIQKLLLTSQCGCLMMLEF